jgi:hypothetical protein
MLKKREINMAGALVLEDKLLSISLWNNIPMLLKLFMVLVAPQKECKSCPHFLLREAKIYTDKYSFEKIGTMLGP